MREPLRHRARAGIDAPRARKSFGREPMRADADRRAIGKAQRLDADQRRAGFQAKLARELPAGALLRRIDQLAARLASAGADDLGKARARAQGVGEARRLDIGAAAAFGAHQPALGERRERPAHGVAVDAVGFRNLHLARQLLAGGETAVGNAALDAVGNLPPQRYAGSGVLERHGARGPWIGFGEIIAGVTKRSFALARKLSNIIDNWIQARPGTGMATESAMAARRKAAMTVLAHSDAAAIAECLGTIQLPAHEAL